MREQKICVSFRSKKNNHLIEQTSVITILIKVSFNYKSIEKMAILISFLEAEKNNVVKNQNSLGEKSFNSDKDSSFVNFLAKRSLYKASPEN